jgi:hypothetical protein
MQQRMPTRLRGRPLRTGPLDAAVRPQPRPLPWLAAVCALFVVAQLALVAPGSGLGWDETVYTSQVSPHVPAAWFSAPRARGISFLVAPVVAVTPSVPALRVYLAVLSGAGLLLALWVWRSLLPLRVLVLGGALFAGLWITVFYGPAVMPNLWSAYGTLAAVGCFLRAVGDRRGHDRHRDWDRTWNRRWGRSRGRSRDGSGDRNALAGLAAGVAVVALMRPPDALWLAVALAAAALAVRAWRSVAVLLALAAGVVLGGAEWVVEAYARYGGLSARIHRASEIQGGMSWHFAVDDQARALAGKTLCRPCVMGWEHPATAVWWFLLPLLAAGGLAVAIRARRGAVALATIGCAAAVSVQYLFLIGYAAPRFLLPAYALLALPVADCLLAPALTAAGRLRPVGATVVALGLCAHASVQYGVLAHTTATARRTSAEYRAVATHLHHLGLRPPCVLSGDHAVPIAFYTGCASRQTGGPDRSITRPALRALSRTTPTGVIVPRHTTPPPFTHTWHPSPLSPAPRFHGYRIYVSPRPPGRPSR